MCAVYSLVDNKNDADVVFLFKMEEVFLLKFTQYSRLREELLNTGDAVLVVSATLDGEPL
jgi:predicted NAD-dependent protein-ADP-ribosyltransferase YbiA (DUF1768 family)